MSPLDIVLLLVSFHQVIGSDFSAMSLEFKQCVRGSQKPKIGECLGRSALNFIQKLDESDNVKFVEDFVTVKSETAAVRSLSNVLDTDPVDFRGILENAGAVMGQRSMDRRKGKSRTHTNRSKESAARDCRQRGTPGVV